MVQTGAELTITVSLQTLLHPFASVTVTVYVPSKLTVMHSVVAPVLHKYPAAPGDAPSSLDSPSQKVVSPVIAHTGRRLTITISPQTLLQPFASVTVTEYVPSKLTVIHSVVAPVLHKYPAAPGDAHSSLDP